MRLFRIKRLVGPVFFFIVALWGLPAVAQGALKPIQPAPELLSAERVLQLIVKINGEDTRFIETFRLDPTTNVLSAKRRDLEEAGVKTPATVKPDEVVRLDALGVDYRYDSATQTIDFRLSDDQRVARIYSAKPDSERPKPRADWGALLNYSLFSAVIRDPATGRVQFNSQNAQLDGRAFSDYGVLAQSAIVGRPFYAGQKRFLRLDSTFTASSLDYNATLHAGDFVSSGLAWSRPIHIGGLQIARDFGLQPDFSIHPMPLFNGSAATPSTVDVLVNGAKIYSQDVGSGPYSLTNLPILDASGDAQVVVRDATGKTVQTSLALFNP